MVDDGRWGPWVTPPVQPASPDISIFDAVTWRGSVQRYARTDTPGGQIYGSPEFLAMMSQALQEMLPVADEVEAEAAALLQAKAASSDQSDAGIAYANLFELGLTGFMLNGVRLAQTFTDAGGASEGVIFFETIDTYLCQLTVQLDKPQARPYLSTGTRQYEHPTDTFLGWSSIGVADRSVPRGTLYNATLPYSRVDVFDLPLTGPLPPWRATTGLRSLGTVTLASPPHGGYGYHVGPHGELIYNAPAPARLSMSAYGTAPSVRLLFHPHLPATVPHAFAAPVVDDPSKAQAYGPSHGWGPEEQYQNGAPPQWGYTQILSTGAQFADVLVHVQPPRYRDWITGPPVDPGPPPPPPYLRLNQRDDGLGTSGHPRLPAAQGSTAEQSSLRIGGRNTYI